MENEMFFKKLTKDEMRQIIGGDSFAACTADCPDGSTISCAGDTCSTGSDAKGTYCSSGDHGEDQTKVRCLLMAP